MKPTGIYVRQDELEHIRKEKEMSGMWGSDGVPFGDPRYEVGQLAKKYNLPTNAGLNMMTGEFVLP